MDDAVDKPAPDGFSRLLRESGDEAPEPSANDVAPRADERVSDIPPPPSDIPPPPSDVALPVSDRPPPPSDIAPSARRPGELDPTVAVVLFGFALIVALVLLVG